MNLPEPWVFDDAYAELAGYQAYAQRTDGAATACIRENGAWYSIGEVPIEVVRLVVERARSQ